MLLDCRSEEPDAVPLSDSSLVIVVTNSNVKHKLAGSQVRAGTPPPHVSLFLRHEGRAFISSRSKGGDSGARAWRGRTKHLKICWLLKLLLVLFLWGGQSENLNMVLVVLKGGFVFEPIGSALRESKGAALRY